MFLSLLLSDVPKSLRKCTHGAQIYGILLTLGYFVIIILTSFVQNYNSVGLKYVHLMSLTCRNTLANVLSALVTELESLKLLLTMYHVTLIEIQLGNPNLGKATHAG